MNREKLRRAFIMWARNKLRYGQLTDGDRCTFETLIDYLREDVPDGQLEEGLIDSIAIPEFPGVYIETAKHVYINLTVNNFKEDK